MTQPVAPVSHIATNSGFSGHSVAPGSNASEIRHGVVRTFLSSSQVLVKAKEAIRTPHGSEMFENMLCHPGRLSVLEMSLVREIVLFR